MQRIQFLMFLTSHRIGKADSQMEWFGSNTFLRLMVSRHLLVLGHNQVITEHSEVHKRVLDIRIFCYRMLVLKSQVTQQMFNQVLLRMML